MPTSNEDLLLIIIAIFVPFVSVAIKRGFTSAFWVNLLLTLLLFHLPGVIHAIYIILHTQGEDAIKISGLNEPSAQNYNDGYQKGLEQARAEQEGYKAGYAQAPTSQVVPPAAPPHPSEKAVAAPVAAPAAAEAPIHADSPPTYPSEKH